MDLCDCGATFSRGACILCGADDSESVWVELERGVRVTQEWLVEFGDFHLRRWRGRGSVDLGARA